MTQQWNRVVATAWAVIQARHPELQDAPAPRDLTRTGDPLTTLLHTAAHELARVRGVRETSRAGYYHNAEFATLAREMGLEVVQAGARGWYATSLPEGTAQVYAGEMEALRQTLPAADAPSTSKSAARGYVPASCHCDPVRRIRVSRTELARGRLLCGFCGGEFAGSDGA